MTCTPTDFFMRRTGRLFFDKPSVDNYKTAILNEFVKYFNWSEAATEIQLQELESKMDLAVSFK